jgi:N-glycosylase/DNA lyase
MRDINFIIKEVQSNKEVMKTIKSRLVEFEELGKSNLNVIFSELCFCLMTANFRADRSIEIQKKIGDGFISFSEEELSSKLKEYGHRFPNARSKYIIEAREHLPVLLDKIKKPDRREWLVKNVKGLGYKEASHFLRNIGYKNYAILDFHIIDLLHSSRTIKSKPKCINPRIYVEIENLLSELCMKHKITQSELDLILWYYETETILK